MALISPYNLSSIFRKLCTQWDFKMILHPLWLTYYHQRKYHLLFHPFRGQEQVYLGICSAEDLLNHHYFQIETILKQTWLKKYLWVPSPCSKLEMKAREGVSVHDGSSRPGKVHTGNGLFLCSICQTKKEAMERRRP
ncbi:unnamed protein product [Musa acuminata subsp. burmannicoides]